MTTTIRRAKLEARLAKAQAIQNDPTRTPRERTDAGNEVAQALSLLLDTPREERQATISEVFGLAPYPAWVVTRRRSGPRYYTIRYRIYGQGQKEPFTVVIAAKSRAAAIAAIVEKTDAWFAKEGSDRHLAPQDILSVKAGRYVNDSAWL